MNWRPTIRGRRGHDVEATLVERHSVLSRGTADKLRALGWRTGAIQSDALDWVSSVDGENAHILLANLFLHQLSEEELRQLFRWAANHTRLVVACEPQRSGWARAGARLLPLLGCSRVTCHDGIVSADAGFCGRELSELWPQSEGWQLHEGRAGLFSHVFDARRM
jgi:hypothetical protein